MAKLVIQIPCYNEEESLGITLAALPRQIPGIDCVEWLVVNDGSDDRTVEIARRSGVDYVVDLGHKQGLAKAFMAGIEASLKAGADLIVNTDGDNQYNAQDIEKLILPILHGKADIVIGARSIGDIKHFSGTKKLLERLGSWVVRIASQSDIPDAPSGFRAFSRQAAMQLNVFDKYTYTLETIIQAGQKGIPMTWVPVRTNPKLRQSRLVKNNLSYLCHSVNTLFRIFMTYRPFRFFMILGSVPFFLGFLLGVRWLTLFFITPERARVPSLILAAILLLIGFQTWALGFVADLLAVNRRLLEDLQLMSRRRGFAGEPSDAPQADGETPRR